MLKVKLILTFNFTNIQKTSIGYNSTPPTPDKVQAQKDDDNLQNNDDLICTKVLFNIANKPPSTDNVGSESISTELLFNFAKIPERIEQIDEEC
jgi:hypothetical protein